MKSSVLAITALLITIGVTSPASAQDRWSDRYELADRRSDRYDEDGELYREINQIYREVLGRRVDRSGFRTYADRVEDGKSLEWVRQDVAKSSEAKAAINRIYQQVLGRDADSSGLKTYTKRLQDGWTLQEVRADIIRSQESRDGRQTQPAPNQTPRQSVPGRFPGRLR